MLGTVPFELYQFAITQPGWTKTDASTALGYTMREIDSAVEELMERRLLQRPAEGHERYVAMSPDVALSELVDEDERTLQDLRSAITARRREFSSLVPFYHEARKKLTLENSVEVIEDRKVVRRLLIDYGRDVTEQVLIAQPGQGSTADVHEESVKKDLELLAKGVVRKNISHDSTRDHMPTRRAVAALAPVGGEYRTLPLVPLRMMVFDQKLVIVQRQLDADDNAALVIRDLNLIRTFDRLFHVAWEFAQPFPVEEEDQSPTKLNNVQQSILKGLAAGHGDEAIARRLDINVRTCRRHIAWMLEELGATSRFQAAIKAREVGWI
ncbi:helix-turn-helix transcriptional regulator [Arthrobacter sp. H14]|uniref:helix-turn-helix transcriptional regulator n=1 Tax=Arthrobacter sp. H14 TaxID=1312959 RepID=UPI00047E6B69|nr:helix-turn-helix transcriptional regulator [Arthrobacter sp. H14]